jgi:predicted transcriptional regulator
MEVPFSAATEAQIKQFAASEGKDAAQLVEETMSRVMKRRARFREDIRRSLAAADAGDLVDDDEARAFLEHRERS